MKYKDAKALSLDAISKSSKLAGCSLIDNEFIKDVVESAWNSQAEESPRAGAIANLQEIIETQARRMGGDVI